MASALIHIAVANEINKTLNKDKSPLLIGAIAPDIAKQIGRTKKESHFQKSVEDSIPQLDKFLGEYEPYLKSDPFVLGYYIHLYTDYFWFKYFIPEFVNKNKMEITKLDGTTITCTDKDMSTYIYSDYTNLNIQLIDKYNLDLKIFYNELPPLQDIIQEIPMDKLNILMEKMSLIIENSKKSKEYVFNMRNINQFIETSTNLILADLKERGIY